MANGTAKYQNFRGKKSAPQHAALSSGSERNKPQGVSSSVITGIAARNRGNWDGPKVPDDRMPDEAGDRIRGKGVDKYGLTAAVRRVVKHG